MGRQQVELHLPVRLYEAMVVLLRRNAADRLRRMHSAVDLLVRTVGVFDLVVHRCDMLGGADVLVTGTAVTLASVAGFSQVFSP